MNIQQTAKQYLTLESEIEFLEERAFKLKAELKAAVADFGTEDERGHKYLKLPAPITVNGETFGRFKNERRTRKSLNEARVWELLYAKNLEERCTTTITVIDQDELFACLYEGLISEDEIDSLYDITTSYAFEPVE